MSRKHSNFGHDILPDPKFGSEMITRFVNMVMHSGKKSVAERIVYGALATIEDKNKSAAAVELVETALENVSPMVEVKSRRVGGATTRYRLKCVQSVVRHWQCVGLLMLRVSVVKRICHSVWQVNCSMPLSSAVQL